MQRAALWKLEYDTEKYYKIMAVCLMVCGKETQRISTFADEETITKIEDRWAWQWLRPLQWLFDGEYSDFCSFK